MIRHFANLRILSAAAAALVLYALAASPVWAEPRITVTPTSSYAYDTFVVTGSGFAVGTTLNVAFTDPSGATGNITDAYGNSTTVKVGNDGSWELRVQPGSAFGSTATGSYQLSFCQSDAGSSCWSAALKVSNDVPGMGGGGGTGGY